MQGVLTQNPLHIAFGATYVTLTYDELPTLLAEGSKV